MFVLPRLEYNYDALEPAIGRQIMELHHTKHHQTYVEKLNKAVEGGEYSSDIEELLAGVKDLPEDIQTAVRNNGGGHFNHSLFWQWMSPEGGDRPGGHLEVAIEERYGDLQELVDQFSAQATQLFGSGWVWLMPNLDIVTTQNQDNPIMFGHPKPILGLDVWEHAYYLDYQNQRDKYMIAWWDVVNWPMVEQMYDQLKTEQPN